LQNINQSHSISDAEIDLNIYNLAIQYVNKNDIDSLMLIMISNERIFGHLSPKDTRFLHPIFYAIDHEKIDIIKSMIAKDHEILTIKNQAGLVPFFYAVYSDKKNVVKAMIEANSEVLKQQDKYGSSPFFYAIKFNKSEIEQEIVSSGCFSCFRIGRQPDTTLNIIARAEIGRDLTDIEKENLKEFASNFSLLKNLYFKKAQGLKDRLDVKKFLLHRCQSLLLNNLSYIKILPKFIKK